MMVLINAFKSISRSKGRNILIGIIVFTVAVSSCVALAIKSAAKDAEESGLSMQTITGTITVDREKIMASAGENTASGSENGDRQGNMQGMREMMQQYTSLSLDEMQKYADSDFVEEFYYSLSLSLDASGEFEPYSEESDETDTSSGSQNNPPNIAGGGRGGMIMGGFAMGDFTVTGYSSESAMTDFIAGTSKIPEDKGTVFDVESADYNCIISNELAVFNSLSVGDLITLTNPQKEDEAYAFKIVGIYTNTNTAETAGTMRFSTSMDPANQIYTSYAALKSIEEKSASAAETTIDDNGRESTTALTSQFSGSYIFNNLDDYNSFGEEIVEKGLSDYYTLTSSDISSYESSLTPIKNLSKFATTLLFIILGVGVVILIVLNIFNIRERKYEVGVLTAIGIKKGKVAAQFVIELLAVTFAAIIVGAAVGSVASVPVANGLLASQISAQETAENSVEQSFGRVGNGPGNAPGGLQGGFRGGFNGNIETLFGGAGNAAEYIDTLNATINLGILGQMIGLGLILTVISSLAGIIFVLRYEPLKILANRS